MSGPIPERLYPCLAIRPSLLRAAGAGTLSLQIGATLPAMPFVTSVPWQMQTTLLVGGTLTVGDIGANPPGNYTGTFSITVVQQ